jgi:D-alanyl-D-alanine dipeptidase
MTLYDYEHIPIEECGEPLVNIEAFGFVLEPIYYHSGLSGIPEMRLRQSVADRLAKAREKIAPLNFKIWDGWRPREVQHNIYMKYWKELEAAHPEWDENRLREQAGTFVSVAYDPNRIPIHSTGGSVDLTIIDEKGFELEMGTEFDYFGPKAAALYYEKIEGHELIRENRSLLRRILVEAEFRFDEDEWWHFDYGNQIWASALNKPKAIYGEVGIG